MPELTDVNYDNAVEQWTITNDDVYQSYDDVVTNNYNGNFTNGNTTIGKTTIEYNYRQYC